MLRMPYDLDSGFRQNDGYGMECALRDTLWN